MLTGPLEPFPSPFPRTPTAQTRATMPLELLPREGLLAQTALDPPPLFEVITRFPYGVMGECPACGSPTTGVASVGVYFMTATASSPYRGPLDVVLEGSRPRGYRLEPCGCRLEVR